MTSATKSLKFGIALILIASSVNLTACGKRISPTTIIPSAAPSVFPVDTYPDNNINYPNNAGYTNTPAVATATPNAQSGSFPVDQATLNQWQAKGIAVTGGTIYVSVSDTSGLSKKGSIVKMNSSDGKNWKDLASKWLGLSHPIDATVTGLAVSGGTIIAADSASKMYLVDAAKGTVTTVKTAGGTDVALAPGGLFIANGSIEKSDTSASSRTPIAGLTSTGGVGSDNTGNVYAVSGNVIKKADTTGQVFDVITSEISAPMDVAVDNRNGDIYVLEQSMIKRFDTNGQFLVSFSNSATKAVGIAIDETGAVYVADAGTTYKESKVIKFSASTQDASMSSYGSSYNSNSYGTSNSAYNSNGYNSYSTTKTASTASTTARSDGR